MPQLTAHQEAVSMFTSYAQSGQDQALVAFARQTLPKLRRHLATVQRLAGRT
jgi:putative membrane protein